MPERATPAGEFFQWREAGVGRRGVPCGHCGAETRLPLLENLLEALCRACGRSLALERARALESRRGPAALRQALEGLGLVDLPAPEGPLTPALVEAGSLRRDLRLHLELDPGAGCFRYTGAPLRDLVLPAELDHARRRQRDHGGVLSSWLVDLVGARVGANVRSVGFEAGLPGVLSPDELDADCARRFSPRTLAAYRAIPIRDAGEAWVVAVQDPLATDALEDLEALAGRPIHGVLASADWIARALATLGVDDPSEEVPELPAEVEPEQAPLDALDDPFSSVLLIALEEGADEVWVEPEPGRARVRFRVRGALRAPREVDSGWPSQLAERLGASAAEVSTGALRCEVSGLPVRVGYRVARTTAGPAVTLTLDESGGRTPGLGELGLGLEDLARFEALIEPGGGLIVVAAPPRRGASAAFRAVLERAARVGGAVTTLESPLGPALAGVTQVPASTSALAEARALLSPAPDWLGLDVPLDPRLTALALDAALGGTTTVVALAAPTAEVALWRLEADGVPRPLLERCLRGVLARRVVSEACPHCRVGRGAAAIGCPACAEQGVIGQRALAELWLPQTLTGPSLATQARTALEAGDVGLEEVRDLVEP